MKDQDNTSSRDPRQSFDAKALSQALSAGLYVVATPIGNIQDITYRAVEVLQSVDIVLVEDTRHSGQLLAKLGIKKPLLSLHEHNERNIAESLIQRMKAGEAMALISDAGTPLISDPGFTLVREAENQGVRVVPIPGPSAVITAMSVSGLPTDSFIFSGFLPAKKNERQKILKTLVLETKTLVFYEAPHRLIETIEDMVAIFGPTREAVLARELTKTFETLKRLPLQALLRFILDTHQDRGEIVIIVRGNAGSIPDSASNDTEALRILTILLTELSPSVASALTARITGLAKRELYQKAISLKRESDE